MSGIKKTKFFRIFAILILSVLMTNCKQLTSSTSDKASKEPPAIKDQPIDVNPPVVVIPPAVTINNPRSSAKIYWVGHSLVSATDQRSVGSRNLPDSLNVMANETGNTYDEHIHTVPGAPIGWNWGNPDAAWNGGVNTLIRPLVDSTHAEYGSFDTIVVTEGVAIEPVSQYWTSGFYLRRFMCAALAANPNTELFFYQSWGHLQRTDPEFAAIYNTISPWNFVTYQNSSRSAWETILNEASDPALTPTVNNYNSWRLPGADPGTCNGQLNIKLIPTGAALVALIERLAENRAGDDWSYSQAAVGVTMTAIDLFANPYIDYPANTATVYGGPVDDIHPSHLLVYLNSLVHYATIYRRSPTELSASNNTPAGIASIMQEVAWEVVTSDPLTGVTTQ